VPSLGRPSHLPAPCLQAQWPLTVQSRQPTRCPLHRRLQLRRCSWCCCSGRAVRLSAVQMRRGCTSSLLHVPSPPAPARPRTGRLVPATEGRGLKAKTYLDARKPKLPGKAAALVPRVIKRLETVHVALQGVGRADRRLRLRRQRPRPSCQHQHSHLPSLAAPLWRLCGTHEQRALFPIAMPGPVVVQAQPTPSRCAARCRITARAPGSGKAWLVRRCFRGRFRRRSQVAHRWGRAHRPPRRARRRGRGRVSAPCRPACAATVA
jgi:hypothetical protein